MATVPKGIKIFTKGKNYKSGDVIADEFLTDKQKSKFREKVKAEKEAEAKAEATKNISASPSFNNISESKKEDEKK